MNEEDIYYFNLLKKRVATTFLKENEASIAIENWKGEEIIAFQEDLFFKVKGRVSEKWFYTYFKKTPEKLPRIDMLNLLTRYIGLENWNVFKATQQYKIKKNKAKLNYRLPLIGFLMILIGLFFYTPSKHQYQFCFVDTIKNEFIVKTRLDIKVLQKNESPLHFKTDSLGCFKYESENDYITFVVKSPYHKTDTITRYIHSNNNSTVKVASDDYALLLDYYANGNSKDREKHKEQLNSLIDDNAQIYQFFSNDIGIELYTKEDFIRLTTLPTNEVKRIKILEKNMKSNKIVRLKFIIK